MERRGVLVPWCGPVQVCHLSCLPSYAPRPLERPSLAFAHVAQRPRAANIASLLILLPFSQYFNGCEL